MLNTSENAMIKKDVPITKVGLWALFGTFIVKQLAPIFVSCSAKSHLLKVLEMKEKVTMDICTAWCSCIAGTGECCNHVITTLYKLEYAVSNLFTDPACTSMPCG